MPNSGLWGFLKKHKDGTKAVIRIPSSIDHIRKVSSKILKALGPSAAAGPAAFDIRLGIEEAVRNAIVHGNHSDRRRSVRVSYRIDSGKLTVDVEDEGSGFDHAKVADPTEAANMLRNSGRGVYLIKRVMDEVSFNARGNRITMVKYL